MDEIAQLKEELRSLKHKLLSDRHGDKYSEFEELGKVLNGDDYSAEQFFEEVATAAEAQGIDLDEAAKAALSGMELILGRLQKYFEAKGEPEAAQATEEVKEEVQDIKAEVESGEPEAETNDQTPETTSNEKTDEKLAEEPEEADTEEKPADSDSLDKDAEQAEKETDDDEEYDKAVAQQINKINKL